MNKADNFEVELVSFPETAVAVYEHRAAPSLLGNSIAQFISWRKENGLSPTKSKTFNIIYDDPGVTANANFRFDLACTIKKAVEENKQGVISKVIPAGQCAKVRLIGGDEKSAAVINFLYHQWLSESSFALRDFPLFLERVSFFPAVTEADSIIDIYLPIHKIDE
tara:strand:- start:4148 stop:4642 length:495 start_codon:yes stop_codon:yes gene_type:complete